jgi:transcription elongation GreA/GreB family factor/transcription elongation factor GreA-like protein
MESLRLQDLIEQNRYEDVEALWLEQLESGSFDVNDMLQAAKQLRRHKEKDRAGVLTGLLAERCLESGDWKGRLKVLREMIRHEPLEQTKIQIREAFMKLFPNRPSLSRLFRQFTYDETSTAEDLIQKVNQIERWMECDITTIVHHPRYGAGRVTELNLNLQIVRIDFENKKDVSLEIQDQDVKPLPKDHILRQKLESPETLREQALADPGTVLGRLLETFPEPLKVSEIREMLNGLIPESQWNSWWNAAKKHPQLLASGKGAQAVYSWSASAEDAETAWKNEFEGSDPLGRIEIAKRISNRNSPVHKYFHERLTADARNAFQEKRYALALQLQEFLSKGAAQDNGAGFSFTDVIRVSDPLELLSGLSGPRSESLKEKVLLALPEIFPDRWKDIYKDAFFHEENPRALTLIFEKLQEMGDLEPILDRAFTQPHRYPFVLIWICENATNAEAKFYSVFAPRLDGRFLIHVLTALDEPQFSSLRSRLKNSLEKGLMLQIVQSSLQKTEAEKAIRLLEHSTNLEDYRRDRLKALIYTWVPEMKQKEERIFTTQEALTRKKKELEQLVQIDLPANRKAVGEAAAHGDLRENAEYKAARERQEYLISRVEVLQQEISKARVLEPGQIECSEVRPGTKITLKQPTGKELTLTILGLWDSNPKEGIYSYQSAVGTQLLGKATGEPAEIQGENWTIEKIEPWMGA